MRYSYEKIYFNTYDDLDGIWFAGSDYQGDYSGKEWRTEGTAVTTVRGNKSVTVYKDKYGKITGRSESTTNSQGKTHTVYRDQYGQRTGTSTTSTLKILERLLLQLRSIVINTGSVRVQVPLGKLAIPPLQPIRISMEESKSEETVRGSSFHE